MPPCSMWHMSVLAVTRALLQMECTDNSPSRESRLLCWAAHLHDHHGADCCCGVRCTG